MRKQSEHRSSNRRCSDLSGSARKVWCMKCQSSPSDQSYSRCTVNWYSPENMAEVAEASSLQNGSLQRRFSFLELVENAWVFHCKTVEKQPRSKGNTSTAEMVDECEVTGKNLCFKPALKSACNSVVKTASHGCLSFPFSTFLTRKFRLF